MRAPVGVQRRCRIGRSADGGQDRAIRTSRVGNASRRSLVALVGINHLVSPVPSQRPVSLDATDPDSRTRRHSGQAEGTEFQRNGERNEESPFRSGIIARATCYVFPRGAKFLPPCVVFVREVLAEKLLSSGVRNRRDLSSNPV